MKLKPTICPHCEAVNKVPERYLGQQVKCGACQEDYLAHEAPPELAKAASTIHPFFRVERKDYGWLILAGFVVLVLMVAPFQKGKGYDDSGWNRNRTPDERRKEQRELIERKWERDAKKEREAREWEEQRQIHLLKEEIRRMEREGRWR